MENIGMNVNFSFSFFIAIHGYTNDPECVKLQAVSARPFYLPKQPPAHSSKWQTLPCLA